MKCPSCSQTPASFLRFSFSLQGVSLVRSVQGYFTCRHCGTLLRVTKYGKEFWTLLVASFLLLALFALFFEQLVQAAGIGTVVGLWIGLVLFIGSSFIYGLWRFAQIAAVHESKDPAPAATT